MFACHRNDIVRATNSSRISSDLFTIKRRFPDRHFLSPSQINPKREYRENGFVSPCPFFKIFHKAFLSIHIYMNIRIIFYQTF